MQVCAGRGREGQGKPAQLRAEKSRAACKRAGQVTKGHDSSMQGR